MGWRLSVNNDEEPLKFYGYVPYKETNRDDLGDTIGYKCLHSFRYLHDLFGYLSMEEYKDDVEEDYGLFTCGGITNLPRPLTREELSTFLCLYTTDIRKFYGDEAALTSVIWQTSMLISGTISDKCNEYVLEWG